MNCRNSSTAPWRRTSRWCRTALLGAGLALVGTSNAQVTTNGGSGLAPTYTSLANAITALNAATITSPVVITLTAANPQTAPAGGYVITASGTGVNSIVILGSNNTITAPTPQASGVLTDAIFKIVGGDWITIDGFTMVENPANTTTTAGTNNMTEWGVALLKNSVTDGAQNCSIQGNVITLNRAYQNTFGIYSNVQHTSTAISTAAQPTSPTGSNSGLVIIGNTISNVNTGICVNGGTTVANYDNGLGITGNTITDFGTTGTFSGFLGVSGTVNGIQITNQLNATIDNNGITSSVGGMTVSGTMRGVFYRQSAVPGSGTYTSSISGNNISLRPGVAGATIVGIADETGSTTGANMTMNINNNDFHTTTHTVAGTGAVTFINNTVAEQTVNINGNTFTNMTVNTTGSLTFINNSLTRPTGGVSNTNNNSVVTQFTKSGAGGTILFYDSFSSTTAATGAVETTNGNNFSNMTFSGSATITGWRHGDGSTSAPYGPNKICQNNTFNNIVGGSGSITILTVGYSNTAATNNVSGNIISNISGTGAVTGITSPQGAQNFYNNTITGLSTTGAATVTALSQTTFGSGTQNIYGNKICDIQANNAAGIVNGILISGATGGTTTNIYNNLIGDLRTPTTNAANNLNGINITASTSGANINVHFNTVSLSASSSGTNFGSSALFANSTPNVTLRNNILSNTSTPSGSGNTVAYRRSSATLTTHQAASDRNLYNVPAGANRLVFFDGTNSDATVAAFQTRLADARDDNSIEGAPDFLSTSCGSSDFLHINPATPTFIESGGSPIAGVTTDFDGNTRNVTTPDIGADEFAGTQPAGCSGMPSAGSASATPTELCAGQSTALNNPSPEIATGIAYQWYITTTSGSGYTPISGANSASASSGALTAGTYYILMSTKCTNTGDSALTAEVTVLVNPVPVVSASNDGPACVGGSVAFNGTSDIPGTYSWTGPVSFTSTDEDPSRSPLALNHAGVYSFTATAAGCTSLPATTTLVVNTAPVIGAVTATPNPTCFNGNSQLAVIAKRNLKTIICKNLNVLNSKQKLN